MHTIRRLYFYLVALISLEVVIWGLINLLRTIFAGKSIFPGADTLAQALALILVGVPIFALHWLWAQHAAAGDEEERAATLRAIFLYSALLATLIPLVQNVLALLDRLLISLAGLESFRAMLGGSQSWQDNLIAIVLNGIAAIYFFTILRANWQSLKEPENFGDVRPALSLYLGIIWLADDRVWRPAGLEFSVLYPFRNHWRVGTGGGGQWHRPDYRWRADLGFHVDSLPKSIG